MPNFYKAILCDCEWVRDEYITITHETHCSAVYYMKNSSQRNLITNSSVEGTFPHSSKLHFKLTWCTLHSTRFYAISTKCETIRNINVAQGAKAVALCHSNKYVVLIDEQYHVITFSESYKLTYLCTSYWFPAELD